jgi:hypothetical protein
LQTSALPLGNRALNKAGHVAGKNILPQVLKSSGPRQEVSHYSGVEHLPRCAARCRDGAHQRIEGNALHLGYVAPRAAAGAFLAAGTRIVLKPAGRALGHRASPGIFPVRFPDFTHEIPVQTRE